MAFTSSSRSNEANAPPCGHRRLIAPSGVGAGDCVRILDKRSAAEDTGAMVVVDVVVVVVEAEAVVTVV